MMTDFDPYKGYLESHSRTQRDNNDILKELQHKIEELQNKVNDLQSKVNDLSGVVDTYFQESAENEARNFNSYHQNDYG